MSKILLGIFLIVLGLSLGDWVNIDAKLVGGLAVITGILVLIER